MDRKNKVSIIVAVYNVEKYIRRCVDSLLAQTYQDIEIILVDDGSPDRCGDICDEYERKDSRIKVIHKSNGGVSSAQQAGLDAATGDYVIHADPDDWVEKDMVSQLVRKAIETSADMITCDFYYDGKYRSLYYTTEKDLLRKIVDVNIICVCWNVLVRRAFIIQHDICFTPDWLCYSEDFLFMSRLLVAGARSAHLAKAFYHYCIDNNGSLVHRKTKKQLYSIIRVIEEMQILLNPDDYDEFYTRKKYALQYAFQGGFYKEFKSMYMEIRERIISEGYKENRGGLTWLVAVALEESPYKAAIYLKYNRFLTKIKNLIAYMRH